MPRSTRHKASNRSLREIRKYSDVKEKKGRNNELKSKSIDVCKDLSGSDDEIVIIDDVDVDEYVASLSSKKRKGKEDDGWSGGGEKSVSKRLSRREERSVVVEGFKGEEGKKVADKVESKHHRSEKKERAEKTGGLECDRKSSKSERLVNGGGTRNANVGDEGVKPGGGGDERGGKHGGVKSCNKAEDEFRNLDAARETDRQVRRKNDVLVDGDKHQNGARGLDDRRSSREDISRSGKYKDDRIHGRYQEDADNRHQDDKQKDNQIVKEYTNGRSEEKHARNGKNDLNVSQKKSNAYGNKYDREADQGRDHDYHDYDRGRERLRDRECAHPERERDRDLDREHSDWGRDWDLRRTHDGDREPERGREHGCDQYSREGGREWIQDHDHSHDRHQDRDYDHDHDHSFPVDDKGSRFRDARGRRRTVDVYDDYHAEKFRRVELEDDKDISLSRKGHKDKMMSSSRQKASPSSRTYASMNKYRDGIEDETKYGDSLRDGVTSEIIDEVPKYRSGENCTKFDEDHIKELSERSPSTKASPAGKRERSPSGNVDCRVQNRTSRQWSVDVDGTERKISSSNGAGDDLVNENRQVREFSAKKPSGEEYQRANPPFYHKYSQGNMSSHGPGPSGFRSGADSPFARAYGDDSRGHSGSHYRRSIDPNVGRRPGNARKGAPNWPSPLPDGFLPFPPGPPGGHGPHHGGFPSMLSQFPPVFGVRPSSDINRPGFPYHMGKGDRFLGHVRPIGWQNMVDRPSPHFHGWDASNGLLRDGPAVYGPGHLANAQQRDMNFDTWKPNGDVNLDVTSQKESQMIKASMDEVSSSQHASRTHVESSCLEEDGRFKKNAQSFASSTKEISMTLTNGTSVKSPESASIDDTSNSVRAYLTKLDISMDMADPELYNQFINLAVNVEPEFIGGLEGDIEEMAVAKADIGYLTLGLTWFPAVTDSIFQKAMALYKRQCTNGSSLIFDDNLHSNHTSQFEVEQLSVLKKSVDSPVDHNSENKELSPVILQGFSTTPIGEGKKPVSITSDEMLNGGPLQDELSLDDPGQVPVLTVESAYFDANEPKTISSENVGKKGGGLVLSGDPSKVCGPFNLVSNESDSGILSRILHAPESTH